MEQDSHGYTRFYSDEEDHRLGALGRVFGNIYDFGAIFARGRGAIPNIYGPIALVFKPAVFSKMSDIAITPKSIATHLDRWQQERVRDVAVVDEIVSGDSFKNPVASQWQGCELSCAEHSLSFDALECILVEPITVCGVKLVDHVRRAAKRFGVSIAERAYTRKDNKDAIQELVDTCETLPDNLDETTWIFDEQLLPKQFAEVADERRKRVPGWCKYFYFGTLGECRYKAFLDEMDAYDDRTVCEMCDPGEDNPPALVNYSGLHDNLSGRSLLDVGRCEYCSGISVRCNKCGIVREVYEHEYDKHLRCEGECGLMFMVDRNRDNDGGMYPSVVLLDDDPQ
jgi:hypothetical protein